MRKQQYISGNWISVQRKVLEDHKATLVQNVKLHELCGCCSFIFLHRNMISFTFYLHLVNIFLETQQYIGKHNSIHYHLNIRNKHFLFACSSASSTCSNLKPYNALTT